MNESGIHLVHKPVGATSFSLVRARQERLRSLENSHGDRELPVCHGGALDPFAEGLMLLLVGPATRLMEELHPIPKYYEAVLSWGLETDTGDGAGKPIAGDRAKAEALTPELLDAHLQEQLGWQNQIPPSTSNKRVRGERAYARAHRGEIFELPPSRVYLHEGRFTSHQLPQTSHLSICCRGGYYVRSLARDLGRALGCGAHLTTLRRTRIGPWIDPSGEHKNSLHANDLRDAIVRGEQLLPWLSSRQLTEAEAIAVELKRPIDRGEIEPPSFVLPSGFPAPGAGERDRPAPIRGICQGKLRVLLQEREGRLVLHTDLNGGV